jgi:hypothetical protein
MTYEVGMNKSGLIIIIIVMELPLLHKFWERQLIIISMYMDIQNSKDI